MFRLLSRYAIVALAAGAPLVASAASSAVTTGAVNLRAGPSAQYPLVATLGSGTPVQVEGCVNDYSWCDVWYGRVRGWASASYLAANYQSRRGTIIEFGPLLGLPLVGFVLNSYWDDHYRGRPFYRERDRWARRPAPVFRPAPPRRHEPPPAARPHPGHDHRPGPAARPPGHDMHGGPGGPPMIRQGGGPR